MKKNKIITVYVITGIFALLVACYLFLTPKLVNISSYKSQILESVKTQTGLDLNIENIDFRTNLDLSADIFLKNVKLTYPDDKELLFLDNASVNVSLIPLLFKNIEIKNVRLNNPEISLVRQKNGEYTIESVLKNIKLSGQANQQDFKIAKITGVEAKNYKLKLDDYFYSAPKKFVLSGNLIKISDFNPEKYIKLETKGKLFVQGKPNVNFDVKFRSELPFKNTENTKKQNKNFDPLDGIIKYNFKSNIIADIKLKNVQEDIDIDGFINFDGLSFKINNKTLPESYGKLKFKGKTFDIDSKLFITPESYISVAGNVKDLKKNKLDLSVKSTEINLKDLKDFADTLNNITSANIAFINDLDISGKAKADFKITDNSDFSGYLNILNTNIAYKELSKPVKNINSLIKFNGNKLIFNDIYGFIDNNKFSLSGFVDSDNNADLKFNVNSLNTGIILDLVNKSSLLKEFKPQLKDISSLSGTVRLEATAKGKLNKKISPEMKISLINPAIVHKQAGFPVSFNKGTVLVSDKKIELVDVQANILQSVVYISGSVTDYTAKKAKPEIFIKLPALNMGKIKALSNSTVLDKNSKDFLNSIKSPSGIVSANIKISSDQEVKADMVTNNVFAYYVPSNLPVRITKGVLSTDGKKLEIKSLNVRASNSPLTLAGTVISLAKLPEVDLKANGFIAATDIKKYSSPDLRKSIVARGNIPINATIAGYVDGWKLNSRAKIDNLSYIANINTSGNKLLNINIKGNPASLNFFDSGLSSSSGQKLISITGGISRYSTKNPVLNDVKISLSNLNLSLVEPKGRLKLNGNISLVGNLSKPRAIGNISVKSISIPSMYLTSDNISLALKNNEIFVNTGLLNVLDSKFKVNMALENSSSSPIIVKNMDVSCDYMNADRLQKAFPAVPNQDLPVVVRRGKFFADKMVLNGLQANNTAFNFVINPMNIMKISDLKTSAAGGTASGKVKMNLKNSKVSVDINTKNMEINTLATAFANTPNEIYGVMNGNIDLTTYGYTPSETSNNATGNVVFTVTNGKLSRLGSISQLLKAKNIFSEGFGPQMIDNTLRFTEAGNSNHFKKITGNISVRNGIMYINELSSQGGDMSLFSKGSIRMSNNYAEITTLGTLSDRITSKLGKLPDFSVEKLVSNKLLKKIPGQWGQVISDLRPKPQYPDIEKIPPLSRGSRETDRHFIVKVQGNFYKPGSVKSFKVID